MKSNPNICVGIDLGTTNSEISFVQEGRPIVIRIDGSKIVPSVVSLDHQGNILVGRAAINNELIDPLNTIRCIKRKMGHETIISLGNKNYTPAMISSLILSRLKVAAEEVLGFAVTKAVITVPAFFSEKQRQATMEAAVLAGLEPIRLLNEPTAAALAYALGNTKKSCSLVYDLGGGTFDVSIVNFFDMVMEVKASHGDTELGGTDFDLLIAQKARQQFLDEYQIDLSQNPLAWARVMRASEAAKIKLSTEPFADIIEEFIAKDNNKSLHLKFQISRVAFEEMIKPTIERTLISVRKALEMASITSDQLDKVILVGGSTYIPLVSQMLETELKIAPQAWINPTTVVAIGAAIEAATLSGISIGPHMVDITPHSLGTDCLNEYGQVFNKILIRRNTPLPVVTSEIFYKIDEYQNAIRVKVLQGESINVNNNHCLGEFLLSDLPRSENLAIHVKFELDRSGMLHVSVVDMASGKKMHYTVDNAAKSLVKNANMAELDSIRIVTETIEDDTFVEMTDDEDDFFDERPGDLVEIDATVESQEHQELLTNAQALIDKGELDKVDLDELTKELALAKNNDKEALQRLADIMYYLV